MTEPGRRNADRLWQRLAAAQDAAVASGTSIREGLPAGVGAPGPLARTRSLGHAARRWRLVWFAAAVGVAAPTLVLLAYRNDPAAKAPGGALGAGERALVADARTDLPLRFADGSALIFRAGSAGRLQRPTETGADVVLERGSLEAHVVHADSTLWLVHAGPYRVRVTGTRFAMSWASPTLDVRLFEGSVVVDGALLGAGVPLRAGQRLAINSGVVVIEPLPGADAARSFAAVPGAGAASSSGGPATTDAAHASLGARGHARDDAAGSSTAVLAESPAFDPPVGPAGTARLPRSVRPPAAGTFAAPSDNEWLTLAERGAYGEALFAARRRGWAGLCRRLDAHHLLTLGDVARYSGAREPARRAFEALVARFPEDRLAADAVFSLGRLSFESRRPYEAARWFRRYLGDWPDGPLAVEAAGRLVESAIRADDLEAARSAARAYLARAPRGPQASLAREVLERPVDGQP